MKNQGKKKLVLLTWQDLEHRYIANRLCAEFSIERVIVDAKIRKRNWRRMLKAGPGPFLSKFLRVLYLRTIGDDKKRALALQEVLGKSLTEDFTCPEALQKVDGINSEECAAILDEIKPDAILVYGTAVVRDHILRKAQSLCLNLHTGMSPDYRGTACTFWPVVESRLHLLGATIHECTSDIDGGQIFAVQQTQIHANDGLHHLFARCVQTGGDLYLKVVADFLDKKLTGVPQDRSVGREYLGSELTLGAEWKARRLIRQGIVADYLKERKALEAAVR